MQSLTTQPQQDALEICLRHVFNRYEKRVDIFINNCFYGAGIWGALGQLVVVIDPLNCFKLGLITSLLISVMMMIGFAAFYSAYKPLHFDERNVFNCLKKVIIPTLMLLLAIFWKGENLPSLGKILK